MKENGESPALRPSSKLTRVGAFLLSIFLLLGGISAYYLFAWDVRALLYRLEDASTPPPPAGMDPSEWAVRWSLEPYIETDLTEERLDDATSRLDAAHLYSVRYEMGSLWCRILDDYPEHRYAHASAAAEGQPAVVLAFNRWRFPGFVEQEAHECWHHAMPPSDEIRALYRDYGPAFMAEIYELERRLAEPKAAYLHELLVGRALRSERVNIEALLGSIRSEFHLEACDHSIARVGDARRLATHCDLRTQTVRWVSYLSAGAETERINAGADMFAEDPVPSSETSRAFMDDSLVVAGEQLGERVPITEVAEPIACSLSLFSGRDPDAPDAFADGMRRTLTIRCPEGVLSRALLPPHDATGSR